MAISNAQPIQFWLASEDSYNEKVVCGIETVCYCQPFNLSDPIFFFLEIDGGGICALYDSNDSFLSSHTPSSITADGSYFNLGIWSDLVGEGQYSIKVHSTSDLSGPLVYKTDCLDVRSDHPCTGLITYSNNKDFAGIPYENVSPGPEFNIRIPMVFFHEDLPQEEEVHPLSDDTWLRLSSRIEKKRNLEIGYVPYYMHEKIQLILMQDNIEIDGLMWDKRDPYKKDDANKRYPLRKAGVWLTDKNYIKRNLI